MNVSGYSGNVGNVGQDSFGYHSNRMFSTYDRDNDYFSYVNCAAYFGGGFWYTQCGSCCVNCYGGDGINSNFFWANIGTMQASRMWLLCKYM